MVVVAIIVILIGLAVPVVGPIFRGNGMTRTIDLLQGQPEMMAIILGAACGKKPGLPDFSSHSNVVSPH